MTEDSPLRTVATLVGIVAGTVPRTLRQLDATATAGQRLLAARVVRDLGLLPPNAAFFLIARPLLDMASGRLGADGRLAPRYDARFEPRDEAEWEAMRIEHEQRSAPETAAVLAAHGENRLAALYLRDRQAFERRYERGRQFLFGPPSPALRAYLRSKGLD